MDPDTEFDAVVSRLSQVGTFDCRDPAEAAEVVANALQGWDSLLLESPDLLCQTIMGDSGRQMIHLEIKMMVSCLTRAAEEIAHLRLTGQIHALKDNSPSTGGAAS
jgi:hypothetical protein